MNFNLVEMYNGLLRFNKHILNELAEGLKHLPNLDGVSKGDSLIINEQGNPAWGSAAFIPTFENAAYGKRTNIAKYYGKYVRIIQVINYAKYFRINFIRNGKAYYADSRDKTLFYSIHRLNHFPINFKITKYDWRIYVKNRKENVKPQT